MTTLEQATEFLDAARALLAQDHDIESGGSHGEKQRPNWAMRATNAIDEALSEVQAYRSKHSSHNGEPE